MLRLRLESYPLCGLHGLRSPPFTTAVQTHCAAFRQLSAPTTPLGPSRSKQASKQAAVELSAMRGHHMHPVGA